VDLAFSGVPKYVTKGDQQEKSVEEVSPTRPHSPSRPQENRTISPVPAEGRNIYSMENNLNYKIKVQHIAQAPGAIQEEGGTNT
jgi:hypothetical protein